MKFLGSPIPVICVSIILGLILLLVFYKIRKKIGVSLGVWNFSIALIIGGSVTIPIIFILGEKFLSISVILGLLIGIFTFIIDKKLEKIEKQDILNYKSKFKFYYDCVNNGVTSLEKEKDIKRAELIAKNYPVAKGVDIKVFFEECKTLVERTAKQKILNDAAQRMQQLRDEERAEYNSRLKYANCKENEKTILILMDELNGLLNGYRQHSTFEKRASENLLVKEKDWASRGGAASAIAGPAAGLAVAIETQAQNAKIREHNAAMSGAIAQMQMVSDLHASAKEKAIEEQRKIIAAEKLKLTQKLSDNVVKKHLNVTVEQVEISETKAFRIQTTVEMIKPLIIFDDVPARIDGSFTCVLSQAGKVVGETKMVLPLYGLYPEKNSRVKLLGICLNEISFDTPYSVDVVMDNIWGVEN